MSAEKPAQETKGQTDLSMLKNEFFRGPIATRHLNNCSFDLDQSRSPAALLIPYSE